MDKAARRLTHGRRTARGIAGDQAEDAVSRHLASAGWMILARNIHIGRNELDIVALDPRLAMLVVVEVRSRSVPHFGEPEESVDRGKVERLYTAAWQLVRAGRLPDGRRLARWRFRVDLVTVVRDRHTGEWHVQSHLQGLLPP